jgi:hypothetical protein
MEGCAEEAEAEAALVVELHRLAATAATAARATL